MHLFIFLILLFLNGFCAQAQPAIKAERRLFLLKKLRLTTAQKAQIQQIILEEKLQEYLRNRKLQEILTPEQKKETTAISKRK